VNATKVKEDKWIEVIPGHRKRTKQIATNKEIIKRQVETENRYHVLRNQQEMNEVVEDLESKSKTRGIAKTNASVATPTLHSSPSASCPFTGHNTRYLSLTLHLSLTSTRKPQS
jgi:hypothetical protein